MRNAYDLDPEDDSLLPWDFEQLNKPPFEDPKFETRSMLAFPLTVNSRTSTSIEPSTSNHILNGISNRDEHIRIPQERISRPGNPLEQIPPQPDFVIPKSRKVVIRDPETGLIKQFPGRPIQSGQRRELQLSDSKTPDEIQSYLRTALPEEIPHIPKDPAINPSRWDEIWVKEFVGHPEMRRVVAGHGTLEPKRYIPYPGPFVENSVPHGVFELAGSRPDYSPAKGSKTLDPGIGAYNSTIGSLSRRTGSSAVPQSTELSTFSSNDNTPKFVQRQVTAEDDVDTNGVSGGEVHLDQGLEPEYADGASIASSLSVLLTADQKQSIITHFGKAILSRIPDYFLTSEEADVEIFSRLEQKLKQYSDKVKNDASRGKQRTVSKSIRFLRHDIAQFLGERILAVKPPDMWRDRRIPELAKEASKLNGEMSTQEKVNTWKLDPSLSNKPQTQTSPLDIGIGILDNGTEEGPSSEDWDCNESQSVSIVCSANLSDLSVDSDDNFPTEEQPIYDFMVLNTAFSDLIVDIKRILQRRIGNNMGFISRIISSTLRQGLSSTSSSTQHHVAVFQLDWDVLYFLKSQYEDGLTQELGSVLTVTGKSVDAQMTTVQVYLEENWPYYPKAVLDPLRTAIANVSGNQNLIKKHTKKPKKQSKKVDLVTPENFGPPTNGSLDIDLSNRRYIVRGAESFIIAVAQQLAWLSTACRASFDGLSNSFLDFDKTSINSRNDAVAFHIGNYTEALSDEGEPSCWNTFIGDCVIAQGFPIADRTESMTGLAAKIDLIAHLAGIPIATEYAGGFVLKGRYHLLVPLRRLGNSVQWHILGQVGRRIGFADMPPEFRNTRLTTSDLSRDETVSTQAYFGWAPNVLNKLATSDGVFDYKSMAYSQLKAPSGPKLSLSQFTLGFSHFVQGTATFAVGKKDGVYNIKKPEFYKDLLDDASQLPVVLYDALDDRAWLATAERVILHIILHRHHRKKFKVDGQVVHIEAAEANSTHSVRSAMMKNSDKVIARDRRLDTGSVVDRKFVGMVNELYSTFEGLAAHVGASPSMTGLELNIAFHQRLYGWEYLDVVNRRPGLTLKEARLKGSCGQWPKFVRDMNAPVLFGQGFQDVLEPTGESSLCRNFSKVPQGNSYLTAQVSTLKTLRNESDDETDLSIITSTGFMWQRSAHLFVPCKQVKTNRRKPCDCRRVQVLVRESHSQKQDRVQAAVHPEGAVIFGEASSWRDRFHPQTNTTAEATHDRSQGLQSSVPATHRTLKHKSIRETSSYTSSSSSSVTSKVLYDPVYSQIASDQSTPATSISSPEQPKSTYRDTMARAPEPHLPPANGTRGTGNARDSRLSDVTVMGLGDTFITIPRRPKLEPPLLSKTQAPGPQALPSACRVDAVEKDRPLPVQANTFLSRDVVSMSPSSRPTLRRKQRFTVQS